MITNYDQITDFILNDPKFRNHSADILAELIKHRDFFFHFFNQLAELKNEIGEINTDEKIDITEDFDPTTHVRTCVVVTFLTLDHGYVNIIYKRPDVSYKRRGVSIKVCTPIETLLEMYEKEDEIKIRAKGKQIRVSTGNDAFDVFKD